MTLASRLAALERQQTARQEEAAALGEWFEDEAFLARLPAALLRYLLDPAANAGWLHVLAGNHYRKEPVVLRQEQRQLLVQAEFRLDAQTAAPWLLPPAEQPYQRLYDTPRPFAVWDDLSGAAWVAYWRAHGTTDPAVLAEAGLGDAELTLLAADEAVA